MSHLDLAEVDKLIGAARNAHKNAYCAYSHFPVGAAILTRSGQIFAGCNVENASYGLTICAERNAAFHMVASGAEPKIVAVLIYTSTPEPVCPCGACRQVLYEFGPDARVISVCDGPNKLDTMLREIFPRAFGPHNLK